MAREKYEYGSREMNFKKDWQIMSGTMLLVLSVWFEGHCLFSQWVL